MANQAQKAKAIDKSIHVNDIDLYDLWKFCDRFEQFVQESQITDDIKGSICLFSYTVNLF